MVLNLDEEKLAKDNEYEEERRTEAKSGKARNVSRLNFLRVTIVGGFTILGWRMWDLQINRPPAERQQAQKVLTRDLTVKSPRGLIYDRNQTPLVSNIANYSVAIIRANLPARDKATKSKARQAVYDNLARFLGMTYSVACIPSELLANPDKNQVLNTIEKYISVSAQDIDKKLYLRKAQKLDTSLLVLKGKIPLSEVDQLMSIRELPGLYFLSQAERIVLEAEFRTADFEPVVVWPNVSREDANILDEKRLDLPGIAIVPGYTRQYEKPELLAHILGYTGIFSDNSELESYNKKSNEIAGVSADATVRPPNPYDIDDQVGRQGIEASMEEFLRGRKGGRTVRVDNAGNIVDTVPGSERKPTVGHTIQLTLDTKLQEVVTNALLTEIESARAQKQASNLTAAGVVMDVETGEVYAMVSVPSYNNNLFRTGRTPDQEKELQNLLDDKRNPLINRAITGVYAPGSTFKLITALAGLNEGFLNTRTTFDCNHYIFVPTLEGNGVNRKPFKCWGTHGTQNVEGAIQQSCDIFFYNTAQKDDTDPLLNRRLAYYTATNSPAPFYFRGMGINNLIKYMDMFGVGKRTGIELPSEYRGLLQTPEMYPEYHPGDAWSVGTTFTTAIGQGDTLMTPLHIANMTTAIANGGTLLKPRVVKKVVDADGKTIVPDERVIAGLIDVRPEHIATVKRGMRKVALPGGTADKTLANQMGSLAVAGKTGTAEFGEPIGKDADGNLQFPTLAWFTCFAPYDKPKYVVTTLITTEQSVIEGSTYAVPAAKKILQALFPKETGIDQPTITKKA